MSTNYIEACMEIYVNGVFYTSKTCWVPEEGDSQVEFSISEDLIDLFGHSAIIDAKLEVETTENMSVSCNFLKEEVVELHLDVNNSASAFVERDEQLENNVVKNIYSVLLPPTAPTAPETPENSTTESTQVWLMKKIRGFYRMLFAVPEPLCDPGIPEPTPETGLVDIVQSTVPDPSVSEQEAEFDLVDPEDSGIPDPSISEQEAELDLVDPEDLGVPDSSVSEQEAELDLVDPEDLGVPDPSVSEQEAELDLVDPEDSGVPDPSVSEQEAELDLLDPEDLGVPDPSVSEQEAELDLVDPDDSSIPGPSRSEQEQVASEEITHVWLMKKIHGFYRMLFAVQEPLCDPGIPEPTPETGLVDIVQSTVPDPSISEQKAELDLVDPEDLIVPDPSISEQEAELDLVEPEDLGVPDSSVSEQEAELDLVDPEDSGVPDPSVSEQEAELDLVEPEDLGVPDSSVSEQEAELDLVDPEDSGVPDPSVSEQEAELDLVDPEDSGVPDPSVSEQEAELDLVDPEDSGVPDPSVSQQEAELDLVDPDDSSIPGPSRSEQEQVASEGQEVNDAISDLESLSDEPTDLTGPSGRRSGIGHQGNMGIDQGTMKAFALVDRVRACTLPQTPVTEVWKNVFIGTEMIARDRMRLQELGITHILNAAAVKKKLRVLSGFPKEKDLRETVNTGARYYRGMNITYCGLPTTRCLKINKYFKSAVKFIDKALKNPENKIFIHCTEGVSYAPTLFLAYLIYHQWSVEVAIDYLIHLRYIKPDIDLLKQLAILDEELGHRKHRQPRMMTCSQEEYRVAPRTI